MTKTKLLKFLLWFLGLSMLLAVVPVVMPFSWMIEIHRRLGLGEMPTGPVVEYLVRSLSAFYAVFGALFIFVALDLEHHRRLVRFLGISFAVMGVVFTWVDVVVGLPWWWTAFEGPPGVVTGVVIWWLGGTVE